MRRAGRLLHAALVLLLAAAVVLPAIPSSAVTGPVSSRVARMLSWVSIKQGWAMYAPDPQRAQSYIELTAVEKDGTHRELEETLDARAGWGTTWAWRKTRVDIWRHYAAYHPDRRNDNRTWYLRAVCVREARTGRVPEKIVMGIVKRRFAAPQRVQAGAPGLGEEQRRAVTVQYCGEPKVREMIAADRELRGEGEGPWPVIEEGVDRG